VHKQGIMPDRIETAIPGREPIELISFYEELRDYYAQCELETKRWFVDHIRPDWWIFDVGANIGYYTILFGQLAPRGRVFAFEPTATAAMLRANLQHNNVQNAEIHEIALGAATGERSDRIYRLWGTDGEVKTYPFYKLDDFIDRHGIERVDCIKIDVDSFDFEVLRGAEQTLLKRNPVIVVELNHALAKRDQSAGEALAWLAQRGYRKALVLDRDNFVLQRGADALAGLDDCASLELLFPRPLRIDEKMAASAGTAVGASFVKEAQLQNGAIARALEADTNGSIAARLARKIRSLCHRILGPHGKSPASTARFAFQDIVNVPIGTTAVRWSYALALQLDARMPDSTLTIEVGVQVIDGKLGIAAAGEDPSQRCSPERILAAMPEPQRVVIKARSKEIDSLIFRNVAPDGTKTLFKITSVEARRSAVASSPPLSRAM
jgi:FkbM family methyltransferase